DVPEGGGADVSRERGCEGPQRQGDLPPRRVEGGDRRGGPRRVQGRGARRPRRGGRGPHEDRRPDGPPRGREGVRISLRPVGDVPREVLEELSEDVRALGPAPTLDPVPGADREGGNPRTRPHARRRQLPEPGVRDVLLEFRGRGRQEERDVLRAVPAHDRLHLEATTNVTVWSYAYRGPLLGSSLSSH